MGFDEIANRLAALSAELTQEAEGADERVKKRAAGLADRLNQVAKRLEKLEGFRQDPSLFKKGAEDESPEQPESPV